MERRSPKDIVAGYRLLTEVQRQFPEDSELYNTIGNALFVGKQYGEAVKAFELAVRFDPGSSQREANLAQAYEATGDPRLAQQHLERAMEIDPLNLNAAVTLIRLYDTSGQIDKGRELARKLSELAGRKASE